MAYTSDIAHRLEELLRPTMEGFKYAKSRTQFRKVGDEYSDDLTIDVTSRDGSSYTIAFYVAVAHKQVEEVIAQVEGKKVGPFGKTILQYSPNVKKQDILKYDGEVWWFGLPRETRFEGIDSELITFVRDFAFPYFSRFHDLVETRNSIVLRDGLSLNLTPYRQVLAIDLVLGDRDHAIEYINLLQKEIDSGYHHRWQDFNDFYGKLRNSNTEFFPEFKLTERKKKA